MNDDENQYWRSLWSQSWHFILLFLFPLNSSGNRYAELSQGIIRMVEPNEAYLYNSSTVRPCDAIELTNLFIYFIRIAASSFMKALCAKCGSYCVTLALVSLVAASDVMQLFKSFVDEEPIAVKHRMPLQCRQTIWWDAKMMPIARQNGVHFGTHKIYTRMHKFHTRTTFFIFVFVCGREGEGERFTTRREWIKRSRRTDSRSEKRNVMLFYLLLCLIHFWENGS